MFIKIVLTIIFVAVMIAVGLYSRKQAASVDGFVLGTSSLFGHLGTYKQIMDNIKRECGE